MLAIVIGTTMSEETHLFPYMYKEVRKSSCLRLVTGWLPYSSHK